MAKKTAAKQMNKAAEEVQAALIEERLVRLERMIIDLQHDNAEIKSAMGSRSAFPLS